MHAPVDIPPPEPAPDPEQPLEADYEAIAEAARRALHEFHSIIGQNRGRHAESFQAMARLHVYHLALDDCQSWPDVARHLEAHPGVVDALGLTGPVSRETIRKSWSERFHDLHLELERRAEALRDFAVGGTPGMQLAVGADHYDTEPEITAESVRQEAKREAYDRIRPILTDVVDFDRADNVSVPAESLIDYAGWLARRQDYPESMDTYVADEGLESAPFTPETYRRAVRNKERHKTRLRDGETVWVEPRDWSVALNDDYGGTDNWHSTTEAGIGRFVGELESDGVIDGPVPVCIDGSIRSWHRHPNGADKKPEGVYQEAYFDTNYGWKDLSANAIVDGRSVVLANLSMVPGDRFFQAVKYLVDRATDLVDVECFYADAEFSNTDICRYIHHIGESYVFRKSHRNRVRETMAHFTGRADWTDYEMRSPRKGMTHSTTLFAVEKRGQIGVKKGERRHEDHSQAGFEDFDFEKPEGQLTFEDLEPDDDVEYVAFVTNKEITKRGIDPALRPIAHDNSRTVWGLAEAYRRRWSIETTFRQVKYQFLPATNSRDLGTRRFVWMLAILLYNAWATVNLFVQFLAAHTFDEDRPDPPVRGKVMLEELARTDYG